MMKFERRVVAAESEWDFMPPVLRYVVRDKDLEVGSFLDITIRVMSIVDLTFDDLCSNAIVQFSGACFLGMKIIPLSDGDVFELAKALREEKIWEKLEEKAEEILKC